MDKCEKYQGLLMGLMDGELDQEETVAVSDHLRRCAACREEYDHLHRTAGKIAGVSFCEPQDEVLRAMWKSPYHSLTRNAGLLLVLAGVVTLVAYAAYQFVRLGQFNVPSLAAAAVWVGVAVLLFSVGRERFKTYKTDPYREVER
jgi:anti-sigma factor RsiW